MGYQSCNHHVNQHFQIRHHLDWGSAFNVRQCRIAWFDTSAVTTDGTVPGMETEEPFLYAHLSQENWEVFKCFAVWRFCWKMFRFWKSVGSSPVVSGVGDEFHQSGGLPWLGISDLEAWDMFVVSSIERLPTETLFIIHFWDFFQL